jgi:poly(A) polymerase
MRAIATDIVRQLKTAGHEAYFVGGCVRDPLLGKQPQDYDIATSARPEQVEQLFQRTVPVGRKFGVMLVIEEGKQFQVATFRAESDYRDGRHPGRVTFCDAMADARRRDFTINGLFFDPIENRLHDWVGGEADLRAKTVRTIGDPQERFAEDHLRLLRTVRFAAQLGFMVEPQTFAAVEQSAGKITGVSAERIREELVKLFRPPHAARGLRLLRQSGLLAQILPEIMATIECEQPPLFHPEGSVYDHLIRILEQLPAEPPSSLVWAALLHDIGKPATASRDAQTGQIHFYGHEKEGAKIAGKILRRLRFSRKQIEEIVGCVQWHMQFKDVFQMRRSTLRQMLLRPTFPLELELHRLDCLGSHGCLDHYQYLVEQARKLEDRPEIRPPLLTGNDLVALGMEPGPAMGRLLSEIREKQLQDELKTSAQARTWAKKHIKTLRRNVR